MTVLYPLQLRLARWLFAPVQRMLASERFQKSAGSQPVLGTFWGKWFPSLLERSMNNPVLRWIGIAQSVLLIAGGAAWLALRPS
jgi:hypothetical protein